MTLCFLYMLEINPMRLKYEGAQVLYEELELSFIPAVNLIYE